MKTLNVIFTVFLALIIVQSSYAQSIVGTKHDFSGKAWNTYSYTATEGTGQICKPCHTPHNASTTVTGAPLWNHASTVSTFTLYTSPTFTVDPDAASITQPAGTSKLCLSCHDGTIALDNYVPVGTSTTFLTGTALLGTDLSNDHPVSMNYISTNNGKLFDPATKLSGLGGTVATDMLFGNKMECASCHNVHSNQYAKFLRKSNTASALCLTCHNK